MECHNKQKKRVKEREIGKKRCEIRGERKKNKKREIVAEKKRTTKLAQYSQLHGLLTNDEK